MHKRRAKGTARKTIDAELKRLGYSKLYSKSCMSLLNAQFMHHIIMPKDIRSVTVDAYEKQVIAGLLCATIFLQKVKTKSKVTLKYISFNLRKLTDIDDEPMRKAYATAANEMYDLEERLDDYELIKL